MSKMVKKVKEIINNNVFLKDNAILIENINKIITENNKSIKNSYVNKIVPPNRLVMKYESRLY